MAVMNRFAAVAESLNQTQPWVISKYCFLSEGILFEQVSLLNTSFFLLPLANRALSKVCSPPSTPCSCPSHLSALLKPETPPLLWLHEVKGSSACCATKSLFAQLPRCCGPDAVSPHVLSHLKWEMTAVFQLLKSIVTYCPWSPSYCWGTSEPPHKLEAEGQII